MSRRRWENGLANNDPLSWDAVIVQPWTPPERLNTLVGVHPQFFLTVDKLDHLKQKTSPVHREISTIIFEKAIAILR